MQLDVEKSSGEIEELYMFESCFFYLKKIKKNNFHFSLLQFSRSISAYVHFHPNIQVSEQQKKQQRTGIMVSTIFQNYIIGHISLSVKITF